MIERAIRAWKDPKFRAQLSPEERADLPESPAGPGPREEGDEVLDDVSGGMTPVTSGGNICTLTTECPIGSICCSQVVEN